MVATLKNGKTYALLHKTDKNSRLWEVVELLPSGPIRFTGVDIPGYPTTRIDADGAASNHCWIPVFSVV